MFVRLGLLTIKVTDLTNQLLLKPNFEKYDGISEISG